MTRKLVLRVPPDTWNGLQEMRRVSEVRLGQKVTIEELALGIIGSTSRRWQNADTTQESRTGVGQESDGADRDLARPGGGDGESESDGELT